MARDVSFLVLLLCSLGAPSMVRAGCVCNSEVTSPPQADALKNAAQQITAIMLNLIPGTPVVQHQLAMVTGAMFDAYTFASKEKRLTSASPELTTPLSADQLVGYAGYAALRQIFLATNRSKLKPLEMEMSRIGLDDKRVRDQVGAVFAEKVAARFPLTSPTPSYKAPNPPSKIPSDAQCSSIVDSDGWQPLCIGSTKRDCKAQQTSFLPLVNASLISSNGARDVDQIISLIPPPPSFSKPLKRLPFRKDAGMFTKDYLSVLSASRKLDDMEKTIAEVFSQNPALSALNLALNEAATRKLNLKDSTVLLFSVSAAVRDAFVMTATVKVLFSTIRPISVLQCAYRGRKLRAWAGPYMGVKTFINSKANPWRPYIPTSSSPSYTSGLCASGAAATTVLREFFNTDRPKGANCFIRMPGTSRAEPQIPVGSPGHNAGITDKPNTGPTTIGYSPAKKTTVCWSTWTEYAQLLARSRLFGGIHIPSDNNVGLKFGRRVGRRAFKFVDKKLSSRPTP